MASSYRTDRVSARCDLGDNPRLVFIAPCPPPPGASEHFRPADWFRDSSIHSVHPKPNGPNQTADWQIKTSSKGGRRTALTVQPQILAIDVASQTTAAGIIHGVELPHRSSLRSSRS